MFLDGGLHLEVFQGNPCWGLNMVSGTGHQAEVKSLDIFQRKVGIDSFTSGVVLEDGFGQRYTTSQIQLVTGDGFRNLLGDTVLEATVRGSTNMDKKWGSEDLWKSTCTGAS